MGLLFESFRFEIPSKESCQIIGSLSDQDRILLKGPSGCGKTSLLRAVAGLHPKLSGKIFQNQKRFDLMPIGERKIGFMFQSSALFPHLTVFENLKLVFKNSQSSVSAEQCESKIFEALERNAIEKLKNRLPGELSGGEGQRVALIRSLIIEPNLLLLDEPFSALDVELKDNLGAWVLEKLKKINAPVIAVSHDPEDAVRLDARVIEWDSCIEF